MQPARLLAVAPVAASLTAWLVAGLGGPYDDAFAAMDDYTRRGWTDGLPIVPPTRERVDALLRIVQFAKVAEHAIAIRLGERPDKAFVAVIVLMGHDPGEAFALYVGIAQIPMYFAPLLLGPFVRHSFQDRSHS